MGSLIRPTVGGERARGGAGVSGEASGANTPHICHIIFLVALEISLERHPCSVDGAVLAF